MPGPSDYHELWLACAQAGCPVCRLVRLSVQRYLETWKYELFTDVELRDELRRSQGFCYEHTWQLVRMGASIQLAQAYRSVLSDTMDQLQGSNDGSSAPSNRFFRRLFEDRREALCPACLQRRLAEERQVYTLRRALLDPPFYTQLSASQGLCLPHFSLACELKLADTPGDWLPLLRKAQLACLQRLDEQLAELIRKHDYRFKDEGHGPEMVSWKRAAGLVAGEESL